MHTMAERQLFRNMICLAIDKQGKLPNQNRLFADAYVWDVGNWLGFGRDEHNWTNV